MNVEDMQALFEYMDTYCKHALLLPEKDIRITYCFPKGSVSVTNDMMTVIVKSENGISRFRHPLNLIELKELIGKIRE